MNDDNILSGVLNQLGQTVKQTAKQAVKIPEEMAADLGGQVGSAKQNEDVNEDKTSENKAQWASDEERVKFLRNLYGSTEQISSAKPSADADAKAMADKEEQKKLLELRNQLHKENYYDPTFNPPQKQEERPAEKVENEKKQEMQDLQKKEEKKPPPLAVVREQNKAEMFRGASG
jgi:hypothetical protein